MKERCWKDCRPETYNEVNVQVLRYRTVLTLNTSISLLAIFIENVLAELPVI